MGQFKTVWLVPTCCVTANQITDFIYKIVLPCKLKWSEELKGLQLPMGFRWWTINQVIRSYIINRSLRLIGKFEWHYVVMETT